MKKIQLDGWMENSAWDNTKNLEILYRQRCLKKVVEMTAHKQVTTILSKIYKKGDTILDIGCGSGYLYHSLKSQNLHKNYFGLDASKKLLKIGKKYLPRFGLPKERLINGRLEDLSSYFDHIICINVLTYHDNIYKPLDIFLKYARKSIILRESISNKSLSKYVKDNYLDENVDIRTYINTYNLNEIKKFLKLFKCKYEFIQDQFTGGKPQNVIDHDHYWKFLKITK